MKFETRRPSQISTSITLEAESKSMQLNLNHSPAHTGSPMDEVSALQMQNRSLQVLVGELLVKNEQLRLELAQRDVAAAISATATPPPLRPDR